jgi:glyoxylase-like metal-dependent hydrolase (beta-lactamase superfamily II)
MKAIRRFFGLTLAFLLLTTSGHAVAKDRVTILYDAFSDSKAVTRDWGFSALVEHDGKRILFDTGNNAATFEHNVTALGVDLSKLDFVIISHRHTDHTTGLKYLLSVNPRVPIYAPMESFGIFGGAVPPTLIKPAASLPERMRLLRRALPGQDSNRVSLEWRELRAGGQTNRDFPGYLHTFHHLEDSGYARTARALTCSSGAGRPVHHRGLFSSGNRRNLAGSLCH